MYIVFDIGGTKMRIAGSKDGKELSTPVIVDTPKDFSKFENLFKKAVDEISNGEKILAVAGGVPGTLDEAHEKLLVCKNLQGWINQPLHRTIADITKSFVFIENDTAMVGLGEAMDGAGKGFPIVAYITVSTGVGGSRVVDGKIDRTHFNFEPGYQIVDYNGEVSSLGDLVSGRAIAAKYGKHPAEITDPKVWNEVEKTFAVGVHNALLFWSPDAVIIGGSMVVKKVGISVDNVAKHVEKLLKAFPTVPVIKKAELADSGGLIGSLAYLRQKLSLKS
ncbi:MAG: ROK family protein [Candidatus Pacebacteria bacterium]|nr:ROK family protein [Candidatus Paceibacterota bacterium]